MTVKEIVIEYLKQNDFDGLFNASGECGCDLKHLMCCDDTCDSCEPGKKHLFPSNTGNEGHEFKWVITNSKKKPYFSSEG